MTVLASLIHPMSVEDFHSACFERAARHFPATEIEPLFGPSELDALVAATSEICPHRLRLNRGGTVLAPPRNANSRDLQRWTWENYDAGATIILNYVDAIDLASGRFARALGADLGARVSLTVFATPAGSQGFAPHYDTLDVFVVQLSGQKSWSLGQSAVQLPTLRQGALISYAGDRPTPDVQLSLGPGDILYIPRGVVHWAAAADGPTLHVTADIGTATLGDLLAAASRKSLVDAGTRIERLRRTGDGAVFDIAALLKPLRSVDCISGLCDEIIEQKWDRKIS